MQADFKCPSCGLGCTMSDGEQIVAGIDSTGPQILHVMPTCEDYDALETVEDGTDFMRRARLKEFPESFD